MISAQGFKERLDIDYVKTYFPIINEIAFWFLVSLIVSKRLDIHRVNIIKTYSCGFIDNVIYTWKSIKELKYLNQSKHKWCNYFNKYLLKEKYVNNHKCPCIFLKNLEIVFAITVIYVDDLDFIGILKSFQE